VDGARESTGSTPVMKISISISAPGRLIFRQIAILGTEQIACISDSLERQFRSSRGSKIPKKPTFYGWFFYAWLQR
jgi:hypothetical protein